ncbi:MAG: protein O-GlcNAcase [Sporichthyaceae bacterium]
MTAPVIEHRLSDDPRFDVVGTPPRVTDERYVLEIRTDPDVVTVVHSSERGRQRGTAHARRLVGEGPLVAGVLDEHPRFAVRGIIEGFYGRPWTHEQRLDMVRFLGAHRMNTFVYSPKDDVFTRRRWRDDLPPPERAALAELVEVARDLSIEVSYGLSPGLSIRYGDPAEVDRLLARFAQVAALGVRSFWLLLDDIPTTLQYPSDRDTFPDLVAAHVHVVAEVRRRLDELDPRLHLAVCPTTYHGRGDEPTLAAMGAGTDPRVDLTWTGREICSPELDLADAALFLRTTSRPVLYWDNYPVNDVAMTAELHVGAYRGRDPHLYRFSRGIIANPMDRPESSKIALATIADYLWDPVGYDSDLSWEKAIREVAGEEDAAAFRLFADNVRTSCLEESDSPMLADALARLEFEEEFGDPAAGRELLAALADAYVGAADRLLGPDVVNPVLAAEVRPWVAAFGRGARQLRSVVDGCVEVAEEHGAEEPPTVFGDVLDMFVRSTSGWIDSRQANA